MKPSTREWVAKAEEDYLAALDLARRRKRPLWSGVCFHALQCAEKYLKARMEEAGLSLQRTHDLDEFLDDVAAQLLAVAKVSEPIVDRLARKKWRMTK